MFDLHFRKIQVQGFWLTQVSKPGMRPTRVATCKATSIAEMLGICQLVMRLNVIHEVSHCHPAAWQ